MAQQPKRPANRRPASQRSREEEIRARKAAARRRAEEEEEYEYEREYRSSSRKKAPVKHSSTSSHASHGSAHHKKKKKNKGGKIVLFIIEILILLVMVFVLYSVLKTEKVGKVDIPEEDIVINEEVKEKEETTMKGYRNIALFGVDSREGQLDKKTRSDTIMIASINQDTGECKLVSVYRDTYLNLGNDSYNKCNAAYAKGGPEQAINMLNMNLDMNITDFVTVGFAGLTDTIDALGGIQIDVHENEIQHLNNYQISMVGKQDGTVNAKGEPNYVATAGVDYTPVTKAGLQTLNGLQATAYCRIRYVGNDFARTQRQRTVIEKVAKKAMTLNPATLNNIANAVFPKIATSLYLSEIIELLGGITGYTIGETASFPFDGSVQTGRVRKMSVVIPQDLEYNVTLLHQMLFDEQDYTPSSTVKTCSSKIASDTGVYYTGQ